jgi:integrase
MASIEGPKGGPYRVRWRTPDGASRSKTFRKRRDAEQYRSSVEHSKSTGVYIDPSQGRVMLEAWATRWLDTVRPTLKPKTLVSYQSLLRSRVLPAFGKRRLTTLRPSDVQEWVGAMHDEGLSASRQAAVVLRQVLDAAVRDGRVARNATHGVRLPKVQHEEAAYLEPVTVERIAAAMPHQYELLVRVLGTVGLRWGEATGLKRRHVDLLRRRLRVEDSLAEVEGRLVEGRTKTHAARNVPLSPSLASALSTHLDERVAPEPDAYVFTSPNGACLRHRNFYERVWLPTLDSLGLQRLGLHVLRHSAAARLIAAGATRKPCSPSSAIARPRSP